MNHKDVIVIKPWGYEYLVYENKDVALWFLHINEGSATSMHCHPKKTTGLVLLDGEAELSFLADKRILKAPDKVMIRRGLFHQTKALSKSGVDIFEIETPNDKLDLVRLKDNYGRESRPYEGSTYEMDRNDSCVWIEDNKIIEKEIWNCKIETWKIKYRHDLRFISDSDIVIFLKGGMIRIIENKEHLVTVPGDVGFGKIIKEVASQLDGVAEDTFIIVIKK